MGENQLEAGEEGGRWGKGRQQQVGAALTPKEPTKEPSCRAQLID